MVFDVCIGSNEGAAPHFSGITMRQALRSPGDTTPQGDRMISELVRTARKFLAFSAITFAAACSGAGTNPIIPGMGNEVPLARVDGQGLPVTLASSATEQTSVVGGKATLGE